MAQKEEILLRDHLGSGWVLGKVFKEGEIRDGHLVARVTSHGSLFSKEKVELKA